MFGLNSVRISRTLVLSLYLLFVLLSFAGERGRKREEEEGGRGRARARSLARVESRGLIPRQRGPSSIDPLFSLTCRLLSLACTPALDKGRVYQRRCAPRPANRTRNARSPRDSPANAYTCEKQPRSRARPRCVSHLRPSREGIILRQIFLRRRLVRRVADRCVLLDLAALGEKLRRRFERSIFSRESTRPSKLHGTTLGQRIETGRPVPLIGTFVNEAAPRITGSGGGRVVTRSRRRTWRNVVTHSLKRTLVSRNPEL